MDGFLSDLRFAARQLRRQPGFAAVAVLTLGIGIGAATSIFNAAEVALYRPLPFEHQDRLVRVYRVPESGTPWISLRPSTYEAVERRGEFFDRIVAQRYTTFVRPTDNGPEQVVGIAVTAGWAETLGVRPHLGRVFTPEEEALGSASGVALLSHGAWQRLYGGVPDIVGRTIILNDRAHSIVGVMQRGLRYPYDTDLWVPMRSSEAQSGPWSFNVLARIRPGVTVESARGELSHIAEEAAVAGEAPALTSEGMTLTAIPFRTLFVQDEARITVALLGAVSFLLLIVCANLASLLLARGLGRERELAVRSSLGASRGRLVRQLFTESLLLGVAGAGLGVALALAGSGLAQPLLPSRLSFVEATVAMNELVLAFAVGLALFSTFLFGLFPALRLSAGGLGTDALRGRGGSDGKASRQTGRGLVVAELALGIMLLSGAGLILQELRQLGDADLGYAPDGLVTFTVPLNREPYLEPGSRLGLLDRARTELRGLPGVSAAGATTMFPSENGNAVTSVDVAGREYAPGSQRLVNHRLVTPDYFDALGLPVVLGRGIEERDGPESARVVVISAATARRLWPGQDPVGERVRRSGDVDEPWMTVVGVVADVREFYDIAETWYVPYAQEAGSRSASSVTFAVRSIRGEPPAEAAIRETMARAASDLPVVDLTRAEDLHAASLTHQRQAAGLSTAFAGFGLLLAAMGLYGSISYAVNRRRREFGIRLALGSGKPRILRDVLGEGARLLMVGTVLGAGGAWGSSRLLAGALETVDGLDPLALGISVLVLSATALIAAALPARRAARVDPARVLREE